MYYEAFTCPKAPSRPHDNDDRAVAYEDRLFAVIDGVTDKSGARLPDGRSRGQAAGRLIEGVLRSVVNEGISLTITAAELLRRIEGAFQHAYRELGIVEAAGADPHLRFAAQLAAALRDGPCWRLLVVGDCGVRLNGREVLLTPHPGDAIVSLWRATVVRGAQEHGAQANRAREDDTPPPEALRAGRAYALRGTGAFLEEEAGAVPRTLYQRLRDEALATAPARFPDLPADVVRDALHRGILGLARERNRPGPLGFASIDGFPVRLDGVIDRTLAASDVTSIELFSDGYFGLPEPPPRAATADVAGATAIAAPCVADWERHLSAVEREDPYKIGRYASTKGSAPGRFSDDRTVLVLRDAVPTAEREDRQTGDAAHAG